MTRSRLDRSGATDFSLDPPRRLESLEMVRPAVDRVEAVQEALTAQRFSALVVTTPPNMAYICGFRPYPYERLIAIVILAKGPMRLVVPTLEEEAARTATSTGNEIYAWPDHKGPMGALRAALKGVDGRIGIESPHITLDVYNLLVDLVPSASFVDCAPLFARLRIAKDESEIANLRQAAAIADRAMARVAQAIEPGRAESDLAALADYLLREAGEPPPFPPVVLTGRRSALPHGQPGPTRIETGDLVIVDIGASVNGYCSDMSRTYVAGREPDRRQRELFEVVRSAQTAGINAAVAGAPAAAVDSAARSVIQSAGFDHLFIHRTGHGIGLEVHEAPSLHSANSEPLPTDAVVTIEPGIYLSDYGGVRIEDDVVVGEAVSEVLTLAPVRLDSLG